MFGLNWDLRESALSSIFSIDEKTGPLVRMDGLLGVYARGIF